MELKDLTRIYNSIMWWEKKTISDILEEYARKNTGTPYGNLLIKIRKEVDMANVVGSLESLRGAVQTVAGACLSLDQAIAEYLGSDRNDIAQPKSPHVADQVLKSFPGSVTETPVVTPEPLRSYGSSADRGNSDMTPKQWGYLYGLIRKQGFDPKTALPSLTGEQRPSSQSARKVLDAILQGKKTVQISQGTGQYVLA